MRCTAEPLDERSPIQGSPPVLASSNPLSTRHQRFACARLSQSYLPKSRSQQLAVA